MKTLLLSRKFWATILTLLVVVVAAVMNPDFTLDTENLSGLAVVAMSYILGVAVDPGPGGWRGVIQSRKFWAAVLGFLIGILNAFGVQLPEGLTVEVLNTLCYLISALIASAALQRFAQGRPAG